MAGAKPEDRLIELKRIAAMGEMTGLEARIIGPEEVAERLPLLRVDDLCGALWVGEDGQVNPVDLCMAYAKGARAGGVRIREEAGVASFETDGRRIAAVLLDDGSRIACESLVICGGVWSRQLGALAGVSIPVQAAEHIYVVTEPIPDLPQPFPILRDLEGGIYIKEDAGKLVLGGFEANAEALEHRLAFRPRPPSSCCPEDWDQAEPFLTAGLQPPARCWSTTGLQHFMNGPEGFTPDTQPAHGTRAPELRQRTTWPPASTPSASCLFRRGRPGHGRLGAWTARRPWTSGRSMSRATSPAAASRRLPGQTRLPEALHNQFDMHWPFKQNRTGPRHQALAAAR